MTRARRCTGPERRLGDYCATKGRYLQRSGDPLTHVILGSCVTYLDFFYFFIVESFACNLFLSSSRF
jgi:hypothetical protein